jgi:hypothetical protein
MWKAALARPPVLAQVQQQEAEQARLPVQPAYPPAR